MRDAVGSRLQLKSRLLIGVAGMAAMSTSAFAADAAVPTADQTPASPAPTPVLAPAATPAQAMAPIDPPKYLPYIDIGGGLGSGFAIGRATAFVPFWQDLDSLMFVRFGAATGVRHSDGDFNLGLGYRTKIDSEWILGAFAGFDSTQSEFNHTFNQYSFGIEAMSTDWDVRANAYIAKKADRPIADKFQLYIHDTTIAILQGQEAALSGFDGEVGYRVFNTDSTDVRVFAGAYTFHHADVNTSGVGTSFSFPYHDLTGPKLRAEVNVFDLDMLGPQSRLSIEGQVSHDNVHHTSEYIGATLRIPLGNISGAGAQALDDLDRRMTDPVRRNDNVLTQWQFNKPEPVIIYNGSVTSKPTNTLYYAEQRSGTATGSYADQTTIQDATARGAGGKNAFIVLTDAGGSTIDATGTTVHGGETVTGAGVFQVRGASGSAPVFTHAFAPGSGLVSLGTSSGNVLNIDGDANLVNFSIVGPFVDAIYGRNVGDVNIADIDIDGGGAGTNGIVFNQADASGASHIAIDNVSIAGVTNDGVDLTVSQTTGGTSATYLTFSNGSITAGNHGVDVTSSVSGASTASVHAGIYDSAITAGGSGVEMSGTSAAGATLNQSLTIDPTTIYSGGHYGIYVHAAVSGGTFTQNLTIDDVALSGTMDGGLAVAGKATGGHLYQNIDVNEFWVSGADVGIGIVAYGAHGGKVDQTIGLTDISADNAGFAAIAMSSIGYTGALVNQSADLSNIAASHAGAGMILEAYAFTGATATQHIYVSNLAADNNAASGVEATAKATGTASGAPTIVAQYVTIDQASLSNNGHDGVLANAYADTNAVTRQDINVTNATITGNLRGVEINGYAYHGASTQQNIYLAYDIIQHNALDGVDIHVLAQGGNSFGAQYGQIYNVDASYNGDDGFNIGALAIASDAEQQFYMVNATGDHEGRDGLEIFSGAYGYTAGSYTKYPAHVGQNIYAIYGSFSNNARHGVEITNYAVDGASTDQSVFLYGVDISHNARAGIDELSQAYDFSPGSTYTHAAPTHLYADLSVVESTVDNNGSDGITIAAYAFGQTALEQQIKITGSDVSHNTQNGASIYAYATGPNSLDLQYVTITDSVFDHNGIDGASIIAQQYFGFGPRGIAGQIVTIDGSSFSNNTQNGLYIGAFAYGVNGRAEQYFYISNSTFSHNGYDGVIDARVAGNGVGLPGYTCLSPQYSYGGCAFIRQVVDISDSDISHNTHDGIGLYTAIYNYGEVYNSVGIVPGQATLQVLGSHIDYNGHDGIQIVNNLKYYTGLGPTFGYAGGEYQNIYIGGTSISHNAENGLDVKNFVKYGQQFQNIVVTGGSKIDHNAENGIYVTTYAKYASLEIGSLTIDHSSVSSNGYTGIAMHAVTVGGPTPSGFFQQGFYTDTATVNNNGYEGANIVDYTFGLEGAYQIISTKNSSFSGNGTAGPGYYGLRAGLFAVHNYLSGQYVTSIGDTFDGNSGGGLTLALTASGDYYTSPSQAYGAYQQIGISGSHFDHNLGGNGLAVYTQSKYSIVSKTLKVADSAFGNNFGNGAYNYSYAGNGGSLVQLAQIYSYASTPTASGNGASGIEFVDQTNSSSNISSITSTNKILGVTFSNNIAANGFAAHAIDDGLGGYIRQNNYLYGNTANTNDTGILLNTVGNAAQYSYIGSNHVIDNTAYGIDAINGGTNTQYVKVYTLGNDVHGNATDYYLSPTTTHD